MLKKQPIIFEAERMKYPFTGLYYYCKFLGNHIHRQLANNQFQFTAYLPKKEFGVFGNNVHYIQQKSIHKFYLPLPLKQGIWHNTYQNTNYFPKNSKIRVLLTIHDLNFLYDDNKNAFKKKKYLHNIQKLINKSAHIVTISQSTLNDVEQYLNIKNKPTSVIYNGCTLQHLNTIQQPLYKPTTAFLFTIGTITEKKNFHVLPALLVKNNMQLIIAGITTSEDYKKKIIAEAKKHGVEARVIFVGAINENDKQWYYKNCAAFVFPSVAEGFGLPVIEAMSFGTLTILSKHTCLPEIGGNVAYYFDDFDATTMQQNLNNALYNYNQSDKEKIIERANFFTWDKAATSFINVYHKILNS